jgi:ParB/RepB/Spo0J family partition protein
MAIKAAELGQNISAALLEAIAGAPGATSVSVERIPIDCIIPGNNDRKKFDRAALVELADSILENGLLQPIAVRQIGPNLYQIIAGERRFRAWSLLDAQDGGTALGARWAKIPAIVHEADDSRASALMLLENTCRKDLNPVEEALAYKSRIDDQAWTIEQCAKVAGVGPSRVRNRLNLLSLRDDILELVRTGNLDVSYGAALGASGLDGNFQGLAMQALNKNSSPTVAWFKHIISELVEQQSQVSLFDIFQLPVCLQQVIEKPVEPPTPATTIPPSRGRHPLNILASQERYWRDAAADWERLGRHRQKAECLAAAAALETARKLIENATVPSARAAERFTVSAA